jgi:hydrogenase expression/formation protein HypD
MGIRYVDEFRDADLSRSVCRRILEESAPGREYRFMEFCGGHTHAIYRYGILDLLPPSIRLQHGPGCPVCVLPMARIDLAIELALSKGVILASFGDMLRVPGSHGLSLLKARARGADIRMVYSPLETLAIARENPGKDVVFFAIGFETTTPPTAILIRDILKAGIENLSVFSNHVLTPPALRALLETSENAEGDTPGIEGFIGPSHVSTIIGTEAYGFVASRFRRPIVISGFEPLDILQSIHWLVRQVNAGEARVENQFSRAVGPLGNTKAREEIDRYFELRPTFEWRGLGFIPKSALQIRPEFSHLDAECRFSLTERRVADPKACECGEILRGVKSPQDCRIFGTICTPDNPIGSCMVSSEGACAAYYNYGQFRSVESRVEK